MANNLIDWDALKKKAQDVTEAENELKNTLQEIYRNLEKRNQITTIIKYWNQLVGIK